MALNVKSEDYRTYYNSICRDINFWKSNMYIHDNPSNNNYDISLKSTIINIMVMPVEKPESCWC